MYSICIIYRFQPATLPQPTTQTDAPTDATQPKPSTSQGQRAPLFQAGLNFQPFKKDAAKQERYDKYLAMVKEGVQGDSWL